MERRNIPGCSLTFWIEICRLDLLSSCGRPAVDHGERGGAVGCPLHRRFCYTGSSDSTECEENVMMHEARDRVGLPIEHKKDEGPATTIYFVGIKLDSIAMEIWLLHDKTKRL